MNALTGGDVTVLPAPTGQPILGENLLIVAPFYTGATSMGILLLAASGTHDKVTWLGVDSEWFDLSKSGDEFWGLNVTYDAAYFYGYTSPLDTSPGKVLSTAFTTSDTWAASGCGTEFTSTQIYLGTPGSTAEGWATRNTGASPCSTTACINHVASGSPSLWNPNAACPAAPQYFNAEQVACDDYNGCSKDHMIWLSSGGVVQFAGTGTYCGGSYTIASSYVMTACAGGTLYAAQIAYKNGLAFALGDTGTYTGGLGNVYEFSAGSGCWNLLSGGPSSDTVVSINADNSPGDFGGLAGAYAVWATDNADTIWAYCTVSHR